MTHVDSLLSALYRHSCPDPEFLGDYFLGRLAPGDRLTVALHLRWCAFCSTELAMYETSQDDVADGVAVGPFEATSSVLAGFVRRVTWATPRGRPTSKWALADASYASHSYQLGLVSGAASESSADSSLAIASPIQQIYQCEELQVILVVWSGTRGYRKGAVWGMVKPPSAVVGADLWNAAELLDSSAVRRDGRFVFAQLEPGKYFLCLRKDGAEVWLEASVGSGDGRRL